MEKQGVSHFVTSYIFIDTIQNSAYNILNKTADTIAQTYPFPAK